MPYTADDLVVAVRRGASIPDASDLISPADILALANGEVLSVLSPWLRRHRGENYGVVFSDQAVAVAQDVYPIPSRAQGASLRDVVWLDPSGRGHSLPEVTLEQRETYRAGGSRWWPTRYAFCTEGDSVVLLPTPTAADGTLRLRYYQRPSRLVLAEECARINSQSPPAFGVDTTPSAMVSGVAVDVVQGAPPFSVLHTSTVASVAAGPTVTIDTVNEAVMRVQPGDYLALAEETPVIQLPVELHDTLTDFTVARVLEAVGDPRYARSIERAQARLDGMHHVFAPRVDGESRKIIARGSYLRGGRR